MHNHILRLAAVAVSSFCVLSSPAAAQSSNQTEVIEVSGAKQRIDNSGKLRMLSQRTAAAACYFARGVDPEASAEVLGAAAAEFDMILNALESGDPALNIPTAETDRRTLASLAAVRETWTPIKAAVDAILAGNATEAQFQHIYDQNTVLLEAANELVVNTVAAHSSPQSVLKSDSMLIDIAGRQRMLLQKVSKESCMVASGHTDTVEAMTGTADMFETSLTALRLGMPAMNIPAPQTPEIAAGLQDVANDWAEAREFLDALASGMKPDAATEESKFKLLNAVTESMNGVVGLYAIEAAKRL